MIRPSAMPVDVCKRDAANSNTNQQPNDPLNDNDADYVAICVVWPIVAAALIVAVTALAVELLIGH